MRLRDNQNSVKGHYSISLALLLSLSVSAVAQSDMPLGDLAREIRKSKAAPTKTVIDNDNLTQIMDQVASQKPSRGMVFSFDGEGKKFQMSSPDVTCSLSFNAQTTSLISDPYVSRNLPETELVKLEGPATISGDTLELSVYNGTVWDLREITVGVTILRPAPATASYGPAKLIPAMAKQGGEAAAEVTSPSGAAANEKRPDMTILYHMKGIAAPFSTTVFHNTMDAKFDADQDWHWAIVEAKGIPPAAPAINTESAPVLQQPATIQP